MEQQQMAMTQNFVRVATDEKRSDFLRYKEIDATRKDEMFEITLLEWYHWKTLACRSKWIYDLYRVYDKRGNLILETEDEVVELPECNIEWIYVKAYNNNHFEKWESFMVEELPPREHSRYYTLSVVVPLYNSELFMCRTIDSILSSSLEDIELILIDDWSTDNTREIAQRYAKNYWCVKAVHQENRWVSVTRNRWLDMVSWEYMAFCDNDDIVHPYMYERLYQTCKSEWTDIAICPALIRSDINKHELYLTCSARPERTVVYTFEEMVQNRWTKWNIFRVAVRNKIVKTEVARMAQFPTWYTWPWILYEDVAYTSSLYSYIDKFALCKDALYTWDKRKQKTVWTASTWHQACDNEYVWKMFVYSFSYALYNKSWKHLEAHDYTHFKRLIEAYDKFDRPSPLRTHWDIKLRELIQSQRLNENKMIMSNKHLAEIVNRFIY